MKTPEQKAEEYVANAYIVFPQSAVKTAYIAGYNAANEWISIDDELPKQITYTVEVKENGNTLYFYEHYAVKGYFENKAKTESIWIGVYRPCSVGWYFQVIKPQKTVNFTITHWKPLS